MCLSLQKLSLRLTRFFYTIINIFVQFCILISLYTFTVALTLIFFTDRILLQIGPRWFSLKIGFQCCIFNLMCYIDKQMSPCYGLYYSLYTSLPPPPLAAMFILTLTRPLSETFSQHLQYFDKANIGLLARYFSGSAK